MEKLADSEMKIASFSTANREVSLDLLRIIATLMVLSTHLRLWLPIPEALSNIMATGASGVIVFYSLSGYLITKTLDGRKSGLKTYYIKRFNRIIPSYYFVIVLAVVFKQLVLADVPRDVTGLYWTRYFLGLQRVVPTNEYFWDNLYTFWTMSGFLFFYLIAPLLLKYCKTFKSSVVTFVIVYLGQFLNNLIYDVLGKCTGMCIPESFVGGTPFHDLYLFVGGIVLYYALKESKIKEYIRFAIAFMIIGIVLHKTHYLWASITGLFIMGMQGVHIDNRVLRTVIQLMSRYSFPVYLTHSLAADIAYYCQNWWSGVGAWVVVFSLSTCILSSVIVFGIEKIKIPLRKKSSTCDKDDYDNRMI